MVNGNYVLYGDRPSSESEVVDDHVHPRTVEKKVKRKSHRTANELQSTLNLAQLDNDTDSVKYEKRVKEPKLLRYVPTSDIEENFVSEKFETYDLKPSEERPRRYAFTKKPKNPADGSVNYAYSRSSSSCSSPNGNLPTISEHAEQYGTYRVRGVSGLSSPVSGEIMNGFESKLDKYFAKPREVKRFTAKGSHPDSLYRVAPSSVGGGKVARVLRLLRWPAALLLVCVALAVFVYFLMPDNLDIDTETANGTYWDPAAAAHNYKVLGRLDQPPKHRNFTPQGTKTPEIDFYGAETEKTYDTSSFAISTSESSATRKLPAPPVFPDHLTPEVQYGNEKADSDKLRNPKVIEDSNDVPLDDSTAKPHITQKPEKPLQIFFRDGNGITTTTSTETITKAETHNDFTNYGEKYISKNSPAAKPQPFIYKGQYYNPSFPVQKVQQEYEQEPENPKDGQDYFLNRQPANVDVTFTSGHSKVFGISMEDAEKMKSTTQTSTYNTRVSPTLPTWRDGDDSTTKKYPINVNYDVPQCGSTRLAFCRGVLPYDLAGPSAVVNGVDLMDLMSQVEYLVATNCSDRVRQFMCALLEPECSPPPFPPKMPCYNLCKTITDNCDGLIPRELAAAFNCNQYSANNCVAAKSPCFPREFQCGDGSCVPRDWICDGTHDCSAGEDEKKCVICEPNEYRCQSGGCIQRRWMCDGYSDCADGEDELPSLCEVHGVSRPKLHHVGEPGEELAGSAPAPAVHKPSPQARSGRLRNQKIGDNDSSKELLITSDSNNALKRNFTRRPSLARLTPYHHRPALKERAKQEETPQEKKENSPLKAESAEDVNVGDLGFFEEDKEGPAKTQDQGTPEGRTFASVPTTPDPDMTHLDTSINKLEKVIDGAALLRKATEQESIDSPESNSTVSDKDYPAEPAGAPVAVEGSSAHASPCPSGELRCVDGRCITLAQLCDGTVDCSDHADEDNCYT